MLDFGIVLGCRIYVKEITNRVVLNEKDTSIQEGDIIYKVSERHDQDRQIVKSNLNLNVFSLHISIYRSTTPALRISR